MKAFGLGFVIWLVQTFALLASLMSLYFAWIAPTNGAPVWRFVMNVLLFVVFGVLWVASLQASGKDVINLSKRLDQEAEAEALTARGMAE
jgi:hypothetical protein